MKYCFLIAAYLFCGINPAYLLSKAKGFDIRQKGTGNAGASNALITMGRKEAGICVVFDIFKAYLFVKLSFVIFNDPFFSSLTIVACIFGHIFPLFMKFKGGKGLACLGGCAAALGWIIFIPALLVELVLVLIVNYICVIPITGSVALIFIYAYLYQDFRTYFPLTLLAIVMFCKHIGNLKNIYHGTEKHFSYLWEKKSLGNMSIN